MKKTINTFAKPGDFLIDEVEVGVPISTVPHGNVDMMAISCLQQYAFLLLNIVHFFTS